LPGLDERLNLPQLARPRGRLEPGRTSNFVPSADGGIILYLRSRLPFDEAKVKEELPEFLGKLRQYRQSEAINRWILKQAEMARLVIPQKSPAKTAREN